MTIGVLSNTQHISTAYTLDSTLIFLNNKSTSLIKACLAIIGKQHAQAILEIQNIPEFKNQAALCPPRFLFGAITAFINISTYAKKYYQGSLTDLAEFEAISFSCAELNKTNKFLLGPQDFITSLDSIIEQCELTDAYPKAVAALKLFKSAAVYCLACEKAGIDAGLINTDLSQERLLNPQKLHSILEEIKYLLLERNIITNDFLDIEHTFNYLYEMPLRKLKNSDRQGCEFLSRFFKVYSAIRSGLPIKRNHIALTGAVYVSILELQNIKSGSDLSPGWVLDAQIKIGPTPKTASAVNFQITELFAVDLLLRMLDGEKIAEEGLKPITNRVLQVYFGSRSKEARNFSKHFKMKTRPAIVQRICPIYRHSYQAYIPINT